MCKNSASHLKQGKLCRLMAYLSKTSGMHRQTSRSTERSVVFREVFCSKQHYAKRQKHRPCVMRGAFWRRENGGMTFMLMSSSGSTGMAINSDDKLLAEARWPSLVGWLLSINSSNGGRMRLLHGIFFIAFMQCRRPAVYLASHDVSIHYSAVGNVFFFVGRADDASGWQPSGNATAALTAVLAACGI